jgi:methylmalonyl-CoA mutase N-terminal domain/subunit
VEETARRDGNLVPVVIDAVKAGVTLGEVSDALRRVYHTYDPGP